MYGTDMCVYAYICMVHIYIHACICVLCVVHIYVCIYAHVCMTQSSCDVEARRQLSGVSFLLPHGTWTELGHQGQWLAHSPVELSLWSKASVSS